MLLTQKFPKEEKATDLIQEIEEFVHRELNQSERQQRQQEIKEALLKKIACPPPHRGDK